MRILQGIRGLLNERKNKLLVLLAVSAVTLGTLKTYEHSRKRDAEHILDSVVVVETDGRLSGSGVVLSGGRYVLTVNHVIDGMVEKGRPIVVRYRDGNWAMARLVKRNRHFDIALLEVRTPHAEGLSLVSEDDLRVGAHVRAFGHPFGITWMVSDGIVSRKSYFPPNEKGYEFVIWTTAWIEGGSSGGPLVNDNGEIVGLVEAFMNPRSLMLGAQHLNLCVSGSEILRFLGSP